MAIKDLYVTQHDLQPYYRVTVKDSAGNLIDLTGVTIVFTMKSVGGIVKINRQSTGVIIANQTTNKGEFEYRWQAGNTDTSGEYYIEFEVTPASGGKFTLPGPDLGRAKVVVVEDLDAQ